jgi:hypothetical protein
MYAITCVRAIRLYISSFHSVVLRITVVKLLCMLHMLCLVWGYQFFPLLGAVGGPVHGC